MLCAGGFFVVTSSRFIRKRETEINGKSMDFLNMTFWNNTVLDYIAFLGALALGGVLIFTLGRIALKRIAAYHEKTQSPYALLSLSGVKRYLLPTAYFILFYACMRMLTLHEKLNTLVRSLSVLFAIVMGAMFLASLAALFLRSWVRARGTARRSPSSG